jgi:hypothetical protein
MAINELVVQVPPVVASVNVTEVPSQKLVGPDMVAGAATTVIVFVALQPPDMVYVMVATPVLTAVTTPLPEPIVATDGELDVQVPPGVASV